MKNNPNILVNICMISYNHEQYITKAIDGVILQETDFPFQLIIGEDCSTDTTRKICEEYALKYPEKVKLLSSEKNWGVMPNFIRTLKSCTGKYISLLDGDDYWTDPYKLQKQVDVMEANNSISLVYTNVKEKYENTKLPLKVKYNTPMPEGSCLSEIIKGSFPQTVSVMYRKSMLPEDIATILKSHYKMGDYPLALHLANKGKIKYIPDVTCVYRKNDTSISGTVAKSYLNNINFISSCREVLSDFTQENNIKDTALLKKIDAQLQHWLLTSFSMSLQNHNRSVAKELWLKLKQNATPIPFKHQLLHKSMYLGVLGKGLINFYYKK